MDFRQKFRFGILWYSGLVTKDNLFELVNTN